MVDTRPLTDAISRPQIRLRPPGFQGLQILAGRMNAQSTGGLTWELAMEVPARGPRALGAVGIIAAISQAASGPTNLSVSASLKCGTALSDLDAAVTGMQTVTFGGQTDTGARIDPPPALAGTSPFQVQRRNYLVTDMVPVVPPARSDGRAFPLVIARMAAGSGSVALLGDAADDYTSWVTRPEGYLRMRVNATAGDQKATVAGWGSPMSSGPMVGFAYAHAGPIFNLVSIGDSQTSSRAEDFLGLNFVQRACDLINAGAATGGLVPRSILSHSNLGWPGLTSDCFVQNFTDALVSGIVPDVVMLQVGTVNDTAGNVALTDAVVDTWRTRFYQQLSLCSANGVCPIVWTLPAANYATRNYGASDAKRVAYNEEMKAFCKSVGILCLDAATIVAGGVDGNGQQTILPAFNLDNIHLNAAGHQALAVALVALLKQLFSGYL